MATIDRYVGRIFHANALDLLPTLPSESIDSVIADPMFMVALKKDTNCKFDWGIEPGTGKPHEFWDYHKSIYAQCRRVLKPGGSLAWAMGGKFHEHFSEWFGSYRAWGFSRFLRRRRSQNAFGHIWMVQTREQMPIRFPDDDGLIIVGPKEWWGRHHVCPKSETEMLFMVRHLSEPGQIVLDCFAGSGSTLVAAEKLGRRWTGCDLSRKYCQIALKRLAELRSQ